MRRFLLLGILVVLTGCKSSTPVVKEKPIADPLYTSKMVSMGSDRATTGSGVIPLPPPPPSVAAPRWEGPAQLVSEPNP
jgi:hypothetical protein